MEPYKFWTREGGNEYHKRNWVDWRKRIPFWYQVIEKTGARSVLELGCGPGWNLSAIHRKHPDVVLGGVEINYSAINMAKSAGLGVATEPLFDADLTFTVGCLIHIPRDELEGVMQSMIDNSFKYVLSVEYESVAEEEIEYRGQNGLLWKRPYGQMYEALGLNEIGFGRVGPDDGFDDCIWRLLEK
jgi:hypothetical protein